MAHGGARSGAGRKVGAVTAKTREIANKAASDGLTPLEYMLNILRDEQQPQLVRFEAAKSAAPFVHAKLSSVEAKVETEVTERIRRIENVVVDPINPDA